MIAHRGLKLFENKIMFFPTVSKRIFVKGIEFDVHENSKGEMVVVHDHVDRNKLSTDFLKNFPNFENTKLIVDIKTHRNDVLIAHQVTNDLDHLLYDHDWEICSFSKNCVEELINIKNDRNFDIGYIHNGFLGFPGDDLDINFISLYWKNITPRVVKHYHARGMRVYAWTVPKNKIDYLKDMGVDEVIVDV